MKAPMLMVLLFSAWAVEPDGAFKEEQLRYGRVREAYAEKGQALQQLFERKGVRWDRMEVFLRAYKQDGLLQVFARNRGGEKFQLIKQYRFCYLSGQPGPKRQQGDLQVPEGFYHIDRFNPASSYHLSLGINYPNASDRKLGRSGRLGGDIFIHGDCVSVGCIPITDEKIKELYIMCVQARDAGQQRIPVHIFPTRMLPEALKEVKGDEATRTFWATLQEGHDYFEQHRKLPRISVADNGAYRVE